MFNDLCKEYFFYLSNFDAIYQHLKLIVIKIYYKTVNTDVFACKCSDIK